MNSCNFIGFIASEIIETELSKGGSVFEFKLGIKAKTKKATYIDVVAYGVIGKNITKYVGKGDVIGITSHVREEIFTSSGGRTCKTHKFVVDSVYFIDNSREEKPSLPEYEADLDEADFDEPL